MNRNVQHCFLLDGKTILPIAKQNTCQSDQQINSNETYLLTRFIPSINFTIDSPVNKNNQSPSAITIIIKSFISSENHRKDTSIDKKSSLKKRKNSSSSSSSSSRQTASKRIPTYLSDQTMTKTRLSTFKDQKRSIPVTINFNENPILHSRTLLNIYRNRKQY